MKNAFSKVEQQSKYSLALWGTVVVIFASFMAHVSHWNQIDYFGIHRIGSGLMMILSLVSFIRLYKNPKKLEIIIIPYLISLRVIIIVATILTTLIADRFPEITLIDSLPPFTIFSFPWIAVVIIFVPYYHILNYVIWGFVPFAFPILMYLLLHPEELKTARGLELLLENGFAIVLFIFISLFYARIQLNYQKISLERIKYYSKVIEEQDIRQSTIADAFNQLHNGALQTLALLRRNLQTGDLSSQDIDDQLRLLNEQIRSLTENFEVQNRDLKNNLDPPIAETEKLYLAPGKSLDLDLPFHTLLHDVYTTTIARNFPYLNSIKVKVRSFDPLEDDRLSTDLKREIGFWLEEALCNVGKHAEGATRLDVKGQSRDGEYILSVRDNGHGMPSDSPSGIRHQNLGQGTIQAQVLAKKLGGTFKRETLPQGGVNCTLRWRVYC